MTTALFTNQVLTQATPATVRALLADPLNLPAWATAITTVKPTATGYVLQRSDSAFDQPE
ncbi:SRPBCC family protein [Lactiplantibacillus plantarum]|nr:SRPBCC family protein [Lactiplantibacillus plantarum]MDO7839716.1 SRPBCC family protein [Lactiplantibacillus plantarum]UYF40260.1 SRPBCC family protein [Lactiplantibacillus plantarum]